MRHLDPLRWIGSIFVLALIVGFWSLTVQLSLVNRAFLPSPLATFQSVVSGVFHGRLLEQAGQTILRMLVGWLLACGFGVLLGAAIGISRSARSWLQPTLEFIRPLPAAAIIPLAISIFGLNSDMVLAVVSFGSMWPVLLGTIHGFASVDPALREVAGALQLSRLKFVCKIGLPNAVPDILAGMRLSLTVALIVSVVGEMIASQSGLGQAILLAARSFQSAELFAGIVCLGVIGLAANTFLSLAEVRLLRWQRQPT